MKVVHLNSGVSESSSCTWLHKALLQKGIESEIITSHSDLAETKEVLVTDQGSIFLRALKLLESKYTYHNVKLPGYPFNLSFFGYNITNNPEIRDADVIHLHWICGLLSIRDIRKLSRMGKAVVWTNRDIWAYTGGCHIEFEGCEEYKNNCYNCPFLVNGSKMAHRLLKRKIRLLKGSNIVMIAPSRWMAHKLSESAVFSCNRIAYIPNTRDFDVYKPHSCNEIDKCLNIDSVAEFSGYYNVLFGAVSANTPYKGFSHLEELLRRIKDQHPDLIDKIKVHILGNYEEGSEILNEFSIHKWGFVKDVNKLACIYSIADMFVTPSLADNLPSMIMEALGCETPVLAFDTGGTSDMVLHQQNGFVADYADDDSFYEGFMWILENNLNNTLGIAGRKHMLSEFSYDVVSEKHIELYRDLSNLKQNGELMR